MAETAAGGASEAAPQAARAESAKPRKIWDVPTRAFHWLLVLSLAASWATAEITFPAIVVPASGAFKADILGHPFQLGWASALNLGPMEIHLFLGYWTLALIVFRVLWGLIGTRHARFWSFIKGPVTTWKYGLSLFGAHRETAGHNPMGGLMVLVLLLLVARQVYSGLWNADDIIECGIYQGPFAKFLDLNGQKAMRILHGDNFNLILVAVAVHVLAIAIYRVLLRSDLIGPMITGRKSALRVGEANAIGGTPWLRFAGAALVAGLAAWWIVSTGVHDAAVCVPTSFDFE